MPGSRTNCTTIYLFLFSKRGQATQPTLELHVPRGLRLLPIPAGPQLHPSSSAGCALVPGAVLAARPSSPVVLLLSIQPVFPDPLLVLWQRLLQVEKVDEKVPGEQLRNRDEEKKRCGFIMLVVESAAAGCGIPSCDSLRKNLSKLNNANNAEMTK